MATLPPASSPPDLPIECLQIPSLKITHNLGFCPNLSSFVAQAIIIFIISTQYLT
ncbi:hypothetical protein RchiOBHm_Chr3g0453611 [Rosa chinensis]|uniref:Uncharacterized protein n=1 Tax=Rosa chinensis TaxID=74649 RepID=A0A2P6R6N7_ROSCH|nr:hypothetical protein RchiOBHm_Chr3g0453611 [Rosa chinensis]